MINILLPAMGKSTFFKDYYFPKLMLEIGGETMLEKSSKILRVLMTTILSLCLIKRSARSFILINPHRLLQNRIVAL